MFSGECHSSGEMVDKERGMDITSNATNLSEHVDQSRHGDPDIPMLEVFPSFRIIQAPKPSEEENDKSQPKIPSVTKKKTFLEIVTEKYHGFTWADAKSPIKGKPDSICLPRNITDDNSTLVVQLVNSTTLLGILGNKSDALEHCNVVLFFAPWCMFCAKIAPYYNALARAFPQLNVLAIEAAQFSR
jgi:thiol-disulfide isomerase/thioredoxin